MSTTRILIQSRLMVALFNRCGIFSRATKIARATRSPINDITNEKHESRASFLKCFEKQQQTNKTPQKFLFNSKNI